MTEKRSHPEIATTFKLHNDGGTSSTQTTNAAEKVKPHQARVTIPLKHCKMKLLAFLALLDLSHFSGFLKRHGRSGSWMPRLVPGGRNAFLLQIPRPSQSHKALAGHASFIFRCSTVRGRSCHLSAYRIALRVFLHKWLGGLRNKKTHVPPRWTQACSEGDFSSSVSCLCFSHWWVSKLCRWMSS